MEIITDRLILRPWKESDAESLYEYAKNPDVGPIAGWPIHTSIENSLDIIKNILSEDETYAICLKDDNRAIGSIGLFPTKQTYKNNTDKEIEVGYWIGVPFWGNGYVPEALKSIQRHAFEKLGYNVMWCGYYEGNNKSKIAQEKCGFKYHHTEENVKVELINDIRTIHYTYLTKEEWVKNKLG
ncbi:GNAT family N-acetyltransferase [Gemella sp. GH3]|uniref:GNAT family N-acetyltransferase n=1 Tax=unclassified Gemella TaxID=2624949 RepID=UPI0015CF92C9|nr:MULTISPECIES: GNAT family N-acetyltransferase [unclassified Gemella]MBF0713392.1 GNAT family N-acetyltransferase [Gemella sp. GH3.1]NYS50344.1 GNAT family N-acetyltransferase [Gemella sp. GH3]